MLFLKPQMPVGKYIHNSLRSSHLKSKEQSPHSFLSSFESKCYLLLFPLSKCLPTSQTYEVLPYVFIPVISSCLKWRAFLSNLLFPDSSNTPILPLRSSWRNNSGKPSQLLQAGDMAPPSSVLFVCMAVTLLLFIEMDSALFIFVSLSSGDT